MTTPSAPCDSRLEDCRCVGGHPPHHIHRCAIPGCLARWNRRGEVIQLPYGSGRPALRSVA